MSIFHHSHDPHNCSHHFALVVALVWLTLLRHVQLSKAFQPVSSVVRTTTTHATKCNALMEPATDLQDSHSRLDQEQVHALNDDEKDRYLYNIARKYKLEIFDLDEAIFGFDSQDNKDGIEVIHTSIHNVVDKEHGDGGLGLVLQEMAGNEDGRGLVLVREVFGNAAKADPAPIHVGDTIIGVSVFAPDTGMKPLFKERTTGLNYDRTVQVIRDAIQTLETCNDGVITLELNRMVHRAKMYVEVMGPDGQLIEGIPALAGENLRRLLMRKHVPLYDDHTKRFDMPFSTGDCAGEGICGTCLVDVQRGANLLNPKHGIEHVITKGRPVSWRAACRAVVGYNNKPGVIRIMVHPQSLYENELNPGVKSVN